MSLACMPSFSFISLMVSEKKIFSTFSRKLTLFAAPATNQSKRLRQKTYKHEGLLDKHEKKSNISNETAEIVNFHFSHYKSMGTISCHSNRSSNPTGIKNTIYVEANVLSMYARFQFHPPYHLWFLRRRFFNIFTKINPFCLPDNQSNSMIWTKVV